ncbi:hypothetical protein DFS34DRAFT_668384 [Phlyctochytrium arcticum]|nr:hypothetical protein DFS34DRAFT_668384 [Phlyctochytrium arcticum]
MQREALWSNTSNSRGQKQVRTQETATGTTCAYTSYNITKIAEFAETHTLEETAAYCQALGLDDRLINRVFRFGRGYDGHRDTPVEVLHTFSLGVVKWLLRASLDQMSAGNKVAASLKIDALRS